MKVAEGGEGVAPSLDECVDWLWVGLDVIVCVEGEEW